MLGFIEKEVSESKSFGKTFDGVFDRKADCVWTRQRLPGQLVKYSLSESRKNISRGIRMIADSSNSRSKLLTIFL